MGRRRKGVEKLVDVDDGLSAWLYKKFEFTKKNVISSPLDEINLVFLNFLRI
jgi:hypothetical protein